MTRTISRRKLLHAGGGAITTVGFSALAGKLTSETLHAQSLPVRSVKEDYKEDFFYREDWLGEPWRKPEPVVLIHGNDESSVEWYACLGIPTFPAASNIRWPVWPNSSPR